MLDFFYGTTIIHPSINQSNWIMTFLWSVPGALKLQAETLCRNRSITHIGSGNDRKISTDKFIQGNGANRLAQQVR